MYCMMNKCIMPNFDHDEHVNWAKTHKSNAHSGTFKKNGVMYRGVPRISRWEGMMTFWQIEMLRSDVAYYYEQTGARVLRNGT